MRRILETSFVVLCILVLILNVSAQQNHPRDASMMPEKVMDVIGVKEGMVIGEVGAGRGYFTFRLAHRVGDTGKIYANDIVENVLQTIQKRCKKEGVKNIITILGKVEDPLLPRGKLDMVVMMRALHDFEKPIELLKNVKSSMKLNATLVIIDADPEKFNIDRGHFMTKERVLKTLKKAGFELVKIETFLPYDNIYIFRPNRKGDMPS